MRILKLVLGILSLCFGAFVLFQSCAVSFLGAFVDPGDGSGFAGILISFFMIAGGIVMIASRNSGKRGGSIAAIVVYLMAVLFGAAFAEKFGDLGVYSWMCAVLAVINIIDLFVVRKKKSE